LSCVTSRSSQACWQSSICQRRYITVGSPCFVTAVACVAGYMCIPPLVIAHFSTHHPMLLSGHVGSIILKVPWKHLFPSPSKPVVAVIDDVIIVLSPELDRPFGERALSTGVLDCRCPSQCCWNCPRRGVLDCRCAVGSVHELSPLAIQGCQTLLTPLPPVKTRSVRPKSRQPSRRARLPPGKLRAKPCSNHRPTRSRAPRSWKSWWHPSSTICR